MAPVTDKGPRDVAIWDLPTRLFHWALVAFVACNLFFISPRGGLHTLLHFIAGFAIAGLLLFRLTWGFIGSPRSRFADFLRPWQAVKNYVGRLVRFDPPHSIGHNPLGGWMVAVLLACLTGIVATGLFATGRRAAGPFAHLLAPAQSHQVGEVHQLISNLLIGLVALHVAGVLVDWLLTRDNLVMAMITGRKRLSPANAANEAALVPFSRAIVTGVLALLLFVTLILITNFGNP